jgi:RNA polymerase sigma-70 factor, ECF subfamily
MVEKIESYEPCGHPFLAWLYSIARNLRVDHYRQTARLPLSPIDETYSGDQKPPLASVEQKITQECLRKALGALTEEQASVIIRKFIEDRSNEEVADLLQKPIGAVKSLQHRALASLRKIMEQLGCDES